MRHAGKLATIEDAMGSVAPSIGSVQRYQGREFAESLVKAWLVYLNTILDLNKKMSEDQVELCAMTVVDEYASLKMSDLALIFKRIISGAYGEFYESLSIAKVLSWLRQYFDERCELAARSSLRAHEEHKASDPFNISLNTKRVLRGGKTR